MIKLKILFLLLFLCGPLSIKAFEPYRDLRIGLTKETALYYKRFGFKRPAEQFRPFMFSAIRVARMFPMYPGKSEQDRMLRLFEFGGLESFWQEDFVVLNVPGAFYSNGKVKRVSVDFSAWGLNENSVEWTYAVALAIQQNRQLPKRIGSWYRHPKFEALIKGAKIPKTIKLRKIDLAVAEEYKRDYFIQKSIFRDPEALRKVMIDRAPVWSENTQDDIDSTLIYRVIEELDRKARGWKYGQELYAHEKHALYRHLSQFIE